MRRLVLVSLMGMAACGSGEPADVATKPAVLDKPAAIETPAHKPAAIETPAAPKPRIEPRPVPSGPPPYDAKITSVRFTKDSPVFADAGFSATRIGTISEGTRSVATAAKPAGDGCIKRWIEIAPRGWVCESILQPTTRPPTTTTPVSLTDRDDPPIGVFGVIHDGSEVWAFDSVEAVQQNVGHILGKATSVRAKDVVDVDGVKYWITTTNQLIAADYIERLEPSHFHGAPLDGALALAWSHAHVDEDARFIPPAVVHDAPAADAPAVGKLPLHAQVAVLETTSDFVRVGDKQWVAKIDLRIPALSAPPGGVGEHDRWIDVDLDTQTLVAYEGTRPVYATLVSTGKRFRDTPEELSRLQSKYRTTDLNSTLIDVYSVAEVPWTMFYDKGFALHASYWHDDFGDVKSHGCVNLAPRDARILFDWAAPAVPAGWQTVFSDDQEPGSVVRIRSAKVPDPRFRTTKT